MTALVLAVVMLFVFTAIAAGSSYRNAKHWRQQYLSEQSQRTQAETEQRRLVRYASDLEAALLSRDRHIRLLTLGVGKATEEIDP